MSSPDIAHALPELQIGDVVLISLRCHVCQAISATTDSPFNHSGLVVGFSASHEALVAQSLRRTEVLSLDAFTSQAPSSHPIMVRRSRELESLRLQATDLHRRQTVRLTTFFNARLLGTAFDDQYLWNNRDSQGKEILYCSEMVQKALNSALSRPLRTVKLDFSPLWDFWNRYFHGAVPQGEIGNSPASLARARELFTVE